MHLPHYLSSLWIILLLCSSRLQAQPTENIVFRSGESGYHTFRIPAIIGLSDGQLLAFCEGRKKGSADFGDIDIVLKRSSNGGKTWGELQVIVDKEELQAGNPAPVVDALDPAHPNRIFLFYNTGNRTEHQVREGLGRREIWYLISDDGGKTWQAPVNISTQVHKFAGNALYASADWRSYANTPGHAMQMKYGPHRGRLVIAANHSSGPPLPHFRDYRAHVFFSDDHGQHFQLSEDVAYPGSNESMAAELGTGGILLNTRNQSGDQKCRLISRSNDGGIHWDTTYLEHNLLDPVNQGAVLTIGYNHKQAIIAHTHTQDSIRRNRLMLHISQDDGWSWFPYRTIDEAPAEVKGDYTAYSDLVLISRKHIGVLYERNGYREIVFTRIDVPRQFTSPLR